MDPDLVSILEDCKRESHASRRGIAKRDIPLIDATPADYTETCEHGTPITKYEKLAFPMYNDGFFESAARANRSGLNKCIFQLRREAFTLLDAECRGLASIHPELSDYEVVRKVMRG